MPKKAAKLRPDVNEIAFRVMLEATGQKEKTVPGMGPKNAEAARRGAKGGTKTAARRSKKARSAAASKASQARWHG